MTKWHVLWYSCEHLHVLCWCASLILREHNTNALWCSHEHTMQINIFINKVVIDVFKACGLHQKDPNFTLEKEQRSYGCETIWGWVINYRISSLFWVNYPFNLPMVPTGGNTFIVCIFEIFKLLVFYEQILILEPVFVICNCSL